MPLWGHGLVYINTGFGAADLMAVRPDGEGDVSATHVVWVAKKSIGSKPSQVLVGDLIFNVDDNPGVATCLDAKTGEEQWSKRLTGEFSASPIYADGKIYYCGQDGYTTGRLIGIDIDSTGVVQARYTNGRSLPLGQVALANFANPQGLQQLGDTNWAETFSSGQAMRGQAGTSSFGLIQSGALEASNVDITEQLVNMITAQRNFQANAQMISTSDQITQTIINIR